MSDYNYVDLIGILTVGNLGDAALTNISITENGNYAPPIGFDGFDEVNVNVSGSARLQSKSITSNGDYTPDLGYDGFSDVSVDVQPTLQTKTVTSNGTVTPDAGYDGLSEVNVNVQPTLQTKTVTSNGTVTPDAGYYGLGEVNVNVPTGITINKIADNLNIGDTTTYITAYFDHNITLNKWYIISIKDYNTEINGLFYLSSFGQVITVPLYNGSTGNAYIYADSINLCDYSGDYRNIYCRICEIPSEMEVPMT